MASRRDIERDAEALSPTEALDRLAALVRAQHESGRTHRALYLLLRGEHAIRLVDVNTYEASSACDVDWGERDASDLPSVKTFAIHLQHRDQPHLPGTEAPEDEAREQERLRQRLSASVSETFSRMMAAGLDEPDEPTPEQRRRAELLEQARAARARRKAIEGTDADPLVKARRAADRLRAIKL